VFLTVAVFAIGFVVASSMPPPSQQVETISHPQAANEGSERTAEKQIAYYTKWLAWFTGALVTVSAFQGYFLLRADKTTRIASDAAKRAADSLPIVERAYVYPLIVSAGTTKECIENAKVFYMDDNAGDGDRPSPERATIIFRIKNYGKTPAILKTVYAGFGVSPVTAEIGVSIPESILGEMETTGDISAEMNTGITRNQAQGIMVYTASVGFSGQITFDDIWGNEHTTQFYFVWDKEIERMALVSVETKVNA
jgi:hypothetical protein